MSFSDTSCAKALPEMYISLPICSIALPMVAWKDLPSAKTPTDAPVLVQEVWKKVV